MTTQPPTRDRIESDRDSASITDALLFDMDGVVLEGWGTDESVHSRALEDALAEFGFDADLDASVRRSLERYEYTSEFERTCTTLGVDPVEFYAAKERYSASRAIERLENGARGTYADVRALEALSERHTLALVSNNYDPTVSFVVDHFGLDVFSFVRGRDLGVDGFRRRKPDPYYLEEAMQTLGVDGGIYVGDRETDLLAGKRAGLDPVFIRREHNASVDPTVAPALEVNTLEELADRL